MKEYTYNIVEFFKMQPLLAPGSCLAQARREVAAQLGPGLLTDRFIGDASAT